MTKEEEFLERWQSGKEAYGAWGRLISSEVQTRLAPRIAPVKPDYFLRTPVAPRLKDDQKLIEKAFYRNKDYKNPYEDITDKVGTRFVVLLGSEIRLVEEVLTTVQGWTFSRDRDYEEEQKKNPLKFDYAAVHFVVRPESDLDYEGVRIPAGTPCEVQIKTILQHAYSELTHDTIYKPQIEATPFMQRNAAKAMALLEATNDYFEKVNEDVNRALSNVRKMTADLTTVYRDVVGLDPKPTTLEGLLLDAYEMLAGEENVQKIRAFLVENSFIAERIKAHIAQRNPIFSQPSVLLVYFAVHNSARRAKSAWPLTPNEMEPLLNDLGESIH
ncbi:RelA/SpoT family protein [Sinorhizobium medicae]|uniref:RelA/SpoT family protein n=1 Tax=Sinorhizobium medicae TaxID=110321 RepID=A0A508WT60_9HYPH|nr:MULTISPECIES: RelA/SpoT domain-containing protein [Sinorhizobium]MDE3766148.1 RelA/SpoT domain-containing protein [Sinorhizobium meliloti]MDE3781226.1 RelA/SpoT domain-containing protein [Sinorhizobium meliloti]MDE3804011.1 RelA/SpoT domain-containing protein [Sinorhizobium meliloti]MDX0524992.1 RelA/SpoT family protein [Sinorhizobium medicae]MDX0549425.1 RelA/SpoT family protein [Sinorhizobium medicae]